MTLEWGALNQPSECSSWHFVGPLLDPKNSYSVRWFLYPAMIHSTWLFTKLGSFLCWESALMELCEVAQTRNYKTATVYGQGCTPGGELMLIPVVSWLWCWIFSPLLRSSVSCSHHFGFQRPHNPVKQRAEPLIYYYIILYYTSIWYMITVSARKREIKYSQSHFQWYSPRFWQDLKRMVW